MEIPKWLQGYIDSEGLEHVRSSVEAAELKTAGEIVPMIVHRSTHIGHVPWVIGLTVLALSLPLAPTVHAFFPRLPYWGLEVLILVTAIGLGWLLSRSDFMRRICTPLSDRTSSVLLRAQLEFYESNIKQTEARTGVLIFVSLMEHQAVVLADVAVSSRFPPETWDRLIALLLEEVRRGDLAAGMRIAIERCGDLLAEAFPRTASDRDELPNRLLIEE